MTSAADSPERAWGIARAIAAGLLPPIVAAVLETWRRPDLVLPLFGHRFGAWLAGGVVVLSAAATACHLAAATGSLGPRVPRVALSLIGFLAFTLPALVALALGPIVFVFIYGAAG